MRHYNAAGPASSKSLDPLDYGGLQFELPNGMVPSFPFYRNGLRSVKLAGPLHPYTSPLTRLNLSSTGVPSTRAIL